MGAQSLIYRIVYDADAMLLVVQPGSTPCASGTLGSVFGCSQDTSTPTTTSSQTPSATPNGTDASGNPTNGTNGSGSTTGGTDANGNPVSGVGSNGLSSSGPMAGQTFGGAGIIGVTPASPKASLLIYKKKNHYNEWEFDYDPLMETMNAMGGPGGGPGGSGLGTNPIGLGPGTGTGPGTGPGNTPGFGPPSGGGQARACLQLETGQEWDRQTAAITATGAITTIIEHGRAAARFTRA
jgi:hypothetical protein